MEIWKNKHRGNVIMLKKYNIYVVFSYNIIIIIGKY